MDPNTPKSIVSTDTPDQAPLQYAMAPHSRVKAPYSATFEDALQSAILRHGIDDASTLLPQPTRMTLSSPSESNLETKPDQNPNIPDADLPLPLDDPRRTHGGPTGIKLTHTNGHAQGGPGYSPDDATIHALARDLIERHNIRDTRSLSAVLDNERAQALVQLRTRMQARADARANNDDVERELATLSDQMDMEIKVLNKARERKARRQEARS